MFPKKKILYLTRLDPYEIKSWSGVTLHILKCLKKHYNVITVGPLSNRVRVFYVFKRFLFSLFNIKFDIDRPIKVAIDFANQIEKKITNTHYDAVLTSESYLLSFLKIKKPCFIFTDVLFSTYYSHYFSHLKVHKSTIFEGDYCQKIAISKSKKVFLTSQWAIDDAIKYYKIKKNIFSLLPFGPSTSLIPKKKYLIKIINKKTFEECRFVSIGVHWDRKGMDKAVKLVNHINNLGRKAFLYIIGAKPPEDLVLPKYVKLIDFLDKNKKKDYFLLKRILYKVHFNLLFSKAEAFGVVNVEASAFGLYSITNTVGGIGGAVTNNVNGYMFNENEKISKIAKHVLKIFDSKSIFLKKSFSSRHQYEKNLNWNKISNDLKIQINKNL